MGKKWLLIPVCLAIALALAAALWQLREEKEDALPEVASAPTTPAPTTRPEILFTLDRDPAQPILVWEDSLLLCGTADPQMPLTVQGQVVTVDAEGSFSCRVLLQPGEQTVTLGYKGEETVYQVERRYAVQSFSPSNKGAYHAGQTMFVEVFARKGSVVEVFFQGSAVTMKPAENQLGSGAMEGFVLYTGKVKMPENNPQALELGSVSYRVSCDGITEAYESCPITCEAYVAYTKSDTEQVPEGYWNVGSGYIVELINGNVETFSGRDSNDLSLPTNNYLPAGTVDYGSPTQVHNHESDRIYRALRCGVRVYAQSKNDAGIGVVDSVDCYYGTLPDHNEIAIAGFAVEGHHTYLTLDCLWKAPFYFDHEPQEYRKESSRQYYVEKFDARYVDIRFCYADRIEGELTIPDDHPLFRRAEIIPNTADYTLRLWLKQEGRFYGWHAYYNENDQLVFRFLNPVTVTEADNPYGADLTGVTVMLDVGHGGEDMGAAGHGSYGQTWPEGELNLILAELVKAELESIGATVVMNRTDNRMQLNHQERIRLLQTVAPDYCLSIHHNSSVRPGARGHETAFFTTFSQWPSEHVVATIGDTDVYSDVSLRFYLYYFARQTTCPVVLTENGYLSNEKDLKIILSAEAKQKTAQGLTQGIVNYFLEMNALPVPMG